MPSQSLTPTTAKAEEAGMSSAALARIENHLKLRYIESGRFPGTQTLVYRRGKEMMNASGFEQDLAASKGVTIRHWTAPTRVVVSDGRVTGIELERTALVDGTLQGTGDKTIIACDQIFKAIGQTLATDGEGVELAGGKIAVDAEGRTSLAKVWAGGDCATGGDDLTVTAVAEGRDAAESINRFLGA